jgi:hypothetical protein
MTLQIYKDDIYSSLMVYSHIQHIKIRTLKLYKRIHNAYVFNNVNQHEWNKLFFKYQ